MITLGWVSLVGAENYTNALVYIGWTIAITVSLIANTIAP